MIDIIEKINEGISEEHVIYKNVRLNLSDIGKNYILPSIILCNSGLVVFVNTKEYGPLDRISSKCGNILSYLQNYLNIDYRFVQMYVKDNSNSNLIRIDFLSNSAEIIDKESIVKKITSISGGFLEDSYEDLVQKLKKLAGEKTVTTEFDSEGREYVYKNDTWIKYSDKDPDDEYKQLILFGIFGWSQLRNKRYFQALIYFLTGGGFGLFWLIDVLCMLAGCYKAKRNERFRPLQNKKKALIMLAVAIPVVVVYEIGFWTLISYLMRYAAVAASGLLNSTMNNTGI